LPVVPLYFAKKRPTVEINGALIMVDDERIISATGLKPQTRSIRFRTLGCYPLTAAEESTTANIDGIISDLEKTRMSERAGRLIDGHGSSSMEAKKLEGYF
jgi:sulfate adenylyltransferase subunit 2